MKLLIGNFKGPKGEQGKEGAQGRTGETGARGSRITSGTAITGTSAIGMKFPDTGIADAQMYDHYINTQTGNLYECTVAGAADMAEWVYVGNIKGPTGATGPAGSISDINDQKPTYEEAAKLENINSGETVKLTLGKVKKAISVLTQHYIQKATASILGHVKLSSSAAITIAGEYALDAVEKNAAISGTLANQIGQINSNIDNAILKINPPRILELTDIQTQITKLGYYKIDSINADYAESIGITNNTGDFYAFVLSQNGLNIMDYGNIILSSPRLSTAFYYIQVWRGKANVMLISQRD